MKIEIHTTELKSGMVIEADIHKVEGENTYHHTISVITALASGLIKETTATKEDVTKDFLSKKVIINGKDGKVFFRRYFVSIAVLGTFHDQPSTLSKPMFFGAQQNTPIHIRIFRKRAAVRAFKSCADISRPLNPWPRGRIYFVEVSLDKSLF